jgi:hypothetical protein
MMLRDPSPDASLHREANGAYGPVLWKRVKANGKLR